MDKKYILLLSDGFVVKDEKTSLAKLYPSRGSAHVAAIDIVKHRSGSAIVMESVTLVTGEMTISSIYF